MLSLYACSVSLNPSSAVILSLATACLTKAATSVKGTAWGAEGGLSFSIFARLYYNTACYYLKYNQDYMQALEGLTLNRDIKFQNITSQVVTLRQELEIPYALAHRGTIYQICPPTVLVFPTPSDLSVCALEIIHAQLTEHPNEAVTFPTGGTWEEPYDLMGRQQTIFEPLLHGRRVATVDEYHRIYPRHPNWSMSYKVYTDTRIGQPLGLNPEQWIRPNGEAEDPSIEAARFEEELAREQFALTNLGIGPDPKMTDGNLISADLSDRDIDRLILEKEAIEGSSHVGFVPPGTPPDSKAMYVRLDRGTIFANSKGAPKPDQMPEGAITQSHADFLRSRLRLMAATGPFKQRNVERVLLEPPSVDNPASLVTLGSTIILLDRAAAYRVQQRIGSREATVFQVATR